MDAANPTPTGMKPEQALRKFFGFDAFRLGQSRVITAILEKRDTLVVMPTSAGKSLCFQLPALLMEGITVVVSPLIALMKDQVDSLREKKIAATFINSSLSMREQSERLGELADGVYKLVYVAPERFRNNRFVETMGKIRIAFMAIDEAHCVSMWGHDFRPDYLRIGEALDRLGNPPVSAFTATATPEVRTDIDQFLRLRQPKRFVAGFERPNLELRVSILNKEKEKLARLSDLLERHKKGIIYCATRKKVDAVAAYLAEWDISHIAYHGGMDDEERVSAQEQFMQSHCDVAVATNAFGMGIDRADIRFVVHFQMPGSVEAYYQEAGRAGRDGFPAICEMFFGYRDREIQEFFIEGSNPGRELQANVYNLLRGRADKDHTVRISLQDLTEELGRRTNGMAVSSAISHLNRMRVIERFDIPGARIRGTRILNPKLAAHDLPIDDEALAEKKNRDENKLQALIDYGHASGCRQAWILRYFGETDVTACRCCDNCQSQSPENMRTPNAEELVILQKALSGVARMSWRDGSVDWHPRFGKNRIMEMLLGSKRAEILDKGLNRLTTYGLLKDEGSTYLKNLFLEMERAGFVVRTGGEYPMLTLTAFGESVMKGQSEIQMAWPVRRTTARSEKNVSLKAARSKSAQTLEDNEDYDAELYQILKEKRFALAKKHNLRAYRIFSNQVLQQMAAVQPLTKEEALAISGIGPQNSSKWLSHFLPLIAAHKVEKSA